MPSARRPHHSETESKCTASCSCQPRRKSPLCNALRSEPGENRKHERRWRPTQLRGGKRCHQRPCRPPGNGPSPGGPCGPELPQGSAGWEQSNPRPPLEQGPGDAGSYAIAVRMAAGNEGNTSLHPMDRSSGQTCFDPVGPRIAHAQDGIRPGNLMATTGGGFGSWLQARRGRGFASAWEEVRDRSGRRCRTTGLTDEGKRRTGNRLHLWIATRTLPTLSPRGAVP